MFISFSFHELDVLILLWFDAATIVNLQTTIHLCLLLNTISMLCKLVCACVLKIASEHGI